MTIQVHNYKTGNTYRIINILYDDINGYRTTIEFTTTRTRCGYSYSHDDMISFDGYLQLNEIIEKLQEYIDEYIDEEV